LFLCYYLIYYLQKGNDILDGCSLNISVSALACAISKGKSTAELAALSAFFTQLGDSIDTIAAGNALCSERSEKSNIPNIS